MPCTHLQPTYRPPPPTRPQAYMTRLGLWGTAKEAKEIVDILSK